MLNVIEHGQAGSKPPLLIVHGLYGSGRNWGVIAKRLSTDRMVLAPDMRNHGESFWADTHSYFDLAEDLAEVITAYGGCADVVGHSMGGKAAMILALTQPERVRSLLVADIAPVAYTHDQSQFIEAMRSVDLSRVTKRSDATQQLASSVEDKTLQSFFTQSLDIKEKRWRLNLDVLESEMGKIIGFPEVQGVFEQLCLFLSGAQSDYVLPAHRERIKTLFPKARFAKIPDAGHWLHAEQPRAFVASVRAFLDYADKS